RSDGARERRAEGRRLRRGRRSPRERRREAGARVGGARTERDRGLRHLRQAIRGGDVGRRDLGVRSDEAEGRHSERPPPRDGPRSWLGDPRGPRRGAAEGEPRGLLDASANLPAGAAGPALGARGDVARSGRKSQKPVRLGRRRRARGGRRRELRRDGRDLEPRRNGVVRMARGIQRSRDLRRTGPHRHALRTPRVRWRRTAAGVHRGGQDLVASSGARALRDRGRRGGARSRRRRRQSSLRGAHFGRRVALDRGGRGARGSPRFDALVRHAGSRPRRVAAVRRAGGRHRGGSHRRSVASRRWGTLRDPAVTPRRAAVHRWRRGLLALALAGTSQCGSRVVDAVDLGQTPDAGPFLIWPNASHGANSDPWLVAHHDSLVEMQPRVLVLDFYDHLDTQAAEQQVHAKIDAIAESSRYHGYADSSASAFLEYSLVKLVDLTDHPPPPNATFESSALLPTDASGAFDTSALFTAAFAANYGYPDPAHPSQSLTLCQ